MSLSPAHPAPPELPRRSTWQKLARHPHAPAIMVAAALIALVAAGLVFFGLSAVVAGAGTGAGARVLAPHRVTAKAATRPHPGRAKVRYIVSGQPVRAELPKRPKPVEELTGNIVETTRPLVEVRPRHSTRLSNVDSSVDREVKSRRRKAPGQDLGVVEVEQRSAVQSPQSRSKAPTQISPKQVLARYDATNQDASAPSRPDAAGPGPMALAKNPRAGDRPVSPMVGSAQSGLLLPATSPGNVVHNIQALAGNPGNSDYLPDVDDEGETNLLNTRKFRYWDFFQRIKDRVSSEWEPGRVWRGRDPNGERYGVRDRLTVLRVTLDPDGALKHIAVAHQSGLDFLDDEARRAFTAAGPFPNPPVGLRSEDGNIEFKFGFMFEIATQRFKFQRMAD